jgi:hypothetical protein
MNSPMIRISLSARASSLFSHEQSVRGFHAALAKRQPAIDML